MFSLRAKVVYPGHGVAEISRIVERTVGTSTVSFYELKFLNKDATVLVPMNNASSVGIRNLSSTQNIECALRVLTEPARFTRNHEFSASNWNKRNKDYQTKIRTGDLMSLSQIYRDLKFIETQKELSFGEKTLLQEIEKLLVEEISLVQKSQPDKAVEQLRSLCSRTRTLCKEL